MIKKILIFLAVLIYFPSLVKSEETALQITIPFTLQTFQIDGKLQEEFYKNFLPSELVKFPGGEKLKQKTLAWISTDGEFLYIAFKCFESEMEKIVRKVKERDGNVWFDDCVEVFLDINLDRKTYYHFIINSIGTKYDEFCSIIHGDLNKRDLINDSIWNGEWRAGAFIGKGFWSVEIIIPLYQFLIKENFGLNVCRERKIFPEELGSLVLLKGGDFQQPEKFAEITGLGTKNYLFIKSISKLQFLPSKNNLLSIEIENVSNNPEEVKVELILKDDNSNKEIYQKKAIFQPAEKKKINLVYRMKNQKFSQYNLSVYRGNNKLLYQKGDKISHYFSLSFLAGDSFLPEEEIPVSLDCFLPEELTKNTLFEIRIKGRNKVYLIKKGKVERFRKDKRLILSIPALSPGKYLLNARLVDKEGNFVDEIEKNIEIVIF